MSVLNSILKGIKAEGKKFRVPEFELDNILSMVTDSRINKEKGGTWRLRGENNKVLFKNIAQSITNIHGREGVNFAKVKNKNLKPLWHFHPFKRGWWPSAEDVNLINDKPHLVITRFGTWIMVKTDKTKNKSIIPGKEIDNLGSYLDGLNLSYWEDKNARVFKKNMALAKAAIVAYSKWVKSYGIELKFFISTKNAINFAKKYIKST